MSPSLAKEPRTKQRAIADMIAQCAPTFQVVCIAQDGLYTVETGLGTPMGSVVYDIATGQYKDACAVLCISLGEKTQNVSEDVARSVVAYMRQRDHLLYDEHGRVRDNSFLDYAWPNWRANINCVEAA